MKLLKKIGSALMSERLAKIYSHSLLIAYGAMILGNPATAQSLHDTGVSIFTTLYGLVGVIGGIALLIYIINFKAGNFLGAQNPKQGIVNCILSIGGAFGVVALIQWIKSIANTSGSISSL